VRGISVCRDVSRELGLHLVRSGERPPPPVRTSYTVVERGSKRLRSPEERRALQSGASATAVYELQGELGFTAGEAVTRDLERREPQPELVVVDLRRVLKVDAGGLRLLTAVAADLEAHGGCLVLSAADILDEDTSAAGLEDVLRFRNLDVALEWCEDEVMRRLGVIAPVTEIALDDHQLLADLSAAELGRLVPRLGVVTAEPGSLLVRRGEPAAEVYLVTRGTLSVLAGDAADRRLRTLSAGMTFGEIAYVMRGERTADVRADSDVECRTLPFTLIDEYRDTNPTVHGKLLANMLGVVVSSLEILVAESGHLSS
jgi:glutaminase